MLRALVLPCDHHISRFASTATWLHHRLLLQDRSICAAPRSRSPSERHVELLWAETTALNENDPREAALLQFLDVDNAAGAGRLTRPGGLSHPGAQHHLGIHADGWADQEVRVLLAGSPGEHSLCAVAVSDDLLDQHLIVVVDEGRRRRRGVRTLRLPCSAWILGG